MTWWDKDICVRIQYQHTKCQQHLAFGSTTITEPYKMPTLFPRQMRYVWMQSKWTTHVFITLFTLFFHSLTSSLFVLLSIAFNLFNSKQSTSSSTSSSHRLHFFRLIFFKESSYTKRHLRTNRKIYIWIKSNLNKKKMDKRRFFFWKSARNCVNKTRSNMYMKCFM